MNNKLIIIVPCYNEEEIIEYSIQKLNLLLENLINENLVSPQSKICFVNDGSTDKTEEIVQSYCKNNLKIMLINLAKNSGHQNALLAGINNVDADMIVTIDADLQDNHLMIKDMVKKYLDGYEIVYGIRNKRKTDSVFKKSTAILFYKFMNLIGIKIRENHADFRLMSRSATDKLKEYKERTIFLRGIVQNIGLKSAEIYYDRLERLAGKTKYPFRKMIGLAWTGITSFSVFPLRLITFIGAITSCISIIILFYGIISYFKHAAVQGWTSIIMTIAFFSGIIIMSLGIIGEYLGKVLIEVKNRPLYHIKDIINKM